MAPRKKALKAAKPAHRPARNYIHVVTTDYVPGYETTDVKGLVWGTTVRAKFVGKDILASLRVLVGGEVREYSDMINEARRYVIERMVDNARALGANAVVNMRMGSTGHTLPGTMEIFAYGTAVSVTKK
jgi:uncharacterized protein YbjQ (UPF0145 family)